MADKMKHEFFVVVDDFGIIYKASKTNWPILIFSLVLLRLSPSSRRCSCSEQEHRLELGLA